MRTFHVLDERVGAVLGQVIVPPARSSLAASERRGTPARGRVGKHRGGLQLVAVSPRSSGAAT